MFPDVDKEIASTRRGSWKLRDRMRNDISLTGPTSYTLEQRITQPTRYTKSHHTTEGVYQGTAQRTLDINNSRHMYLSKSRQRIGKRMGKLVWDYGGPFMSETLTYNPVVLPPDGVIFRQRPEPAFRKEQCYGYLEVIPSSNISRILSGEDSRLGDLSNATLRGWGAEGINRTVPTKSEMSLATSAVELMRDGIPNMIGSTLARDKSVSSIGSEYLNYQFGITPLVNDVKDIVRLTQDYEKIIEQFRRDANRVVRRRIVLVDDKDVEKTRNARVYAWTGSPSSDGKRVYTSEDTTITSITTRRIWMSAAYRLSYPVDLDGHLQELKEFNRVFGVIPDASTLWNTLPWSWLIDWFLNVGTLVENATLLGNGTDLLHGYVMGSSSSFTKYEGSLTSMNAALRNQGHSFPYVQTMMHSKKKRIKASPFGFKVDTDALSGYQLSILAALGISRLGV